MIGVRLLHWPARSVLNVHAVALIGLSLGVERLTTVQKTVRGSRQNDALSPMSALSKIAHSRRMSGGTWQPGSGPRGDRHVVNNFGQTARLGRVASWRVHDSLSMWVRSLVPGNLPLAITEFAPSDEPNGK